MAQLSSGHDYYKKMLDLQEKLRKSEEERIRLEERFKILVQESRSRHDACINRLRLRYIEFLEEQRARDERNHKLLGNLDRVDSSLALMTAKTDRLNVLRKQYEVSLLRTYSNRGQLGSITGDSGIASQNEDRSSRRNISIGRVHLISPGIKNGSSSQMLRSDIPFENSLLSASKLNPSTSQPILDSVPLITQSDTAVLQTGLRRNENLPQTTGPLLIGQNNVRKYSFSQSPSPQVYDNTYISPIRIRVEQNLYDPIRATSMVETTPLSHQNVPRNLSQSVQMESVQPGPRLLVSEAANGNVSRYKWHDTSPSIPPRMLSPSAITQSLQYPNNRILATNSQMSPRNTELSSKKALNVPSTPTKLMKSPRTNCQDDARDIRRSFRELGVRSLTSSEIDEIIRRNEEPAKGQIARRDLHNFIPLVKKPITLGKEDEATVNLDNQLDRYIHKIRAKQREHDIQSCEELDLEQNTSGDLLNVSLSGDDLEFATESKPKRQLPEQVEKVLALANDLASSTLDMEDVKDTGNEDVRENRRVEWLKDIEDRESLEDRSYELSGRQGRGSLDLAKDGIRDDTALYATELDHLRNIEQPTKQDSTGLDTTRLLPKENLCDSQLSEVQEGKEPSKKDDENISHRTVDKEEVGRNLYSGEESELELESIHDLVELEPWDLKRIEKTVKEEIDIDDIDKDRSTEKEIVTEESTVNDSSGEQLEVLDLLDSVPIKPPEEEVQHQTPDKDEKNAISQSNEFDSKKTEEQAGGPNTSNLRDEFEGELNLEKDPNDDSQDQIQVEGSKDAEIADENKSSSLQKNDDTEHLPKGDELEMNQARLENEEENVDQQINDNMSQQEYVENPNQSQEYQQEYDYENGQYENNQTYQEYADQQYPEGSNERYGEYSGEQYDQYQEDPNAQYEQDPNQQYQDYNYEEQYDPNQTYEGDPNQTVEYTENIPYDTNAENTCQEGIQSQQDNKTSSEGVEETQEKVEDVVQPAGDQISGNDQEPTQETNIPKKKKDVIRSLLDSDTDSTIERNVSNTESDFDFN